MIALESKSLITTIPPEYMEKVGVFSRKDLEEMELGEFIEKVRPFFTSLLFEKEQFSQISLQENIRDHPDKTRDSGVYTNDKIKIINEIFELPFIVNKKVVILQPRESFTHVITEIKTSCLRSERNQRIGLIFKRNNNPTQLTTFLQISGAQDTAEEFQKVKAKIIKNYSQFNWKSF